MIRYKLLICKKLKSRYRKICTLENWNTYVYEKKIKTTMKNATAYFDGIDKSVINKNIDSAK